MTINRTGEDLVGKGSRNKPLWEAVLRSSLSMEGQVKNTFARYLVDCLHRIIHFAQNNTIGNTTKSMFIDTVCVFRQLAPYLRQTDQRERMQKLVTVEAKKLLKNKKAVVEILLNLDETRPIS